MGVYFKTRLHQSFPHDHGCHVGPYGIESIFLDKIEKVVETHCFASDLNEESPKPLRLQNRVSLLCFFSAS
jgi:hypothetical protein